MRVNKNNYMIIVSLVNYMLPLLPMIFFLWSLMSQLLPLISDI